MGTLLGYDDKCELFEKLIKEDNLAHAYLFYGEPETGKHSFAKSIAYLLEDRKKAEGAPLIDAVFVAAEEGKTLGIEDVARIQKFLSERPMASKKRMVVVDNAESLTREAQGALLKIVEEPPKTSLIIFVSSDSRNIFEALLSRIEKIYFPTFSEKEIASGLVKQLKIEETKAAKIAKMSFGRFGRAVKIARGKKESGEEDDVLKTINDAILARYEAGIAKNTRVLRWLLERQMFIKRYKRYNLNMKLQKKVVDAVLKSK